MVRSMGREMGVRPPLCTELHGAAGKINTYIYIYTASTYIYIYIYIYIHSYTFKFTYDVYTHIYIYVNKHCILTYKYKTIPIYILYMILLEGILTGKQHLVGLLKKIHTHMSGALSIKGQDVVYSPGKKFMLVSRKKHAVVLPFLALPILFNPPLQIRLFKKRGAEPWKKHGDF